MVLSENLRKSVEFHHKFFRQYMEVGFTRRKVTQEKEIYDKNGFPIPKDLKEEAFAATLNGVKGEFGIKSLDNLKDLSEIYNLHLLPIDKIKEAKVKLNGYLFFKENNGTIIPNISFGNDDQLIFNAAVCEAVLKRCTYEAYEYKEMSKTVTQLADVSKLILRAVEEDIKSDLDESMKAYIPFIKTCMEYSINSMRFLNSCLDIASKCVKNMDNPVARMIIDDIVYFLKTNKLDPVAGSQNKGEGAVADYLGKVIVD